jgi:hypothetical protein
LQVFVLWRNHTGGWHSSFDTLRGQEVYRPALVSSLCSISWNKFDSQECLPPSQSIPIVWRTRAHGPLLGSYRCSSSVSPQFRRVYRNWYGHTQTDSPARITKLQRGNISLKYSTRLLIFTYYFPQSVIFQAALQWAAAECKCRSLEVESANCRTVMGDSLFLIRLPTRALEDFANEAAQSGILTLQETTDVFLYYTARNKPSLLYRYWQTV